MKRKFLVLTAIVASMFLFTGCQKEIVAWYKYSGLEEMQYIVAEEDTAVEFFTELGDVLDKYNGTEFNDSDLTSSISSVVSKYNRGVVSGTFSLMKSTTSSSGPWSEVRSWTMKFNSKYTKAADFETGSLSQLQ